MIIPLQGSGVKVEEALNRGEEADFKATKSRFLKVAKMCLQNQTRMISGEDLVMEFEMEALREGGHEEDDEVEDDLVF